MKRLLGMALALMMALCAFGASAEDVCTADARQSEVATACSYLRVTCPDAEGAVMLSVYDAAGRLIYQKDHGVCSGTFRSGEIYLPLYGTETTYQVCLEAGDASYTLKVRRIMPRLMGNTACSGGVSLERITGSDSWRSAAVLDMDALEGSSVTLPIIASGAYTIGRVTFTAEKHFLTVTAEMDAGVDGTIDGATVYVADNALEAGKLDTRRFSGVMSRLDTPIDLWGVRYAAVYVKLTVSFDPAGVPGVPNEIWPDQEQNWEIMRETTINEEVG